MASTRSGSAPRRRPRLPDLVEYVDDIARTNEQVIAVLAEHAPELVARIDGHSADESELRGYKPRPRERSAAA